MTCKKNLCLYNLENECTLTNISINSSGFCAECTCVELDDEDIEEIMQDEINRYGK